MRRALLFLALLVLTLGAHAQKRISGQVLSARDRQPLPFAILTWATAGGPVVGDAADLNGRFSVTVNSQTGDMIARYIGYKEQRISLSGLHDTTITFYLEEDASALGEVVITPQTDKILRIINGAVARRGDHDPERAPFYRCHVYYKMTADIGFPGNGDTGMAALKSFAEQQHLLMSETYSIRSARRPGRVQEDILATQFSGLRGQEFATLVTSVLPFGAHDDFITLNGRDYHNPLSAGWQRRYRFSIAEEHLYGYTGDTMWVLSFRPQKGFDGLTGQLHILSKDFALTRLIAGAHDTVLNRTVRAEQEYAQVDGRWFPRNLNYVFDWEQNVSTIPMKVHMQGVSQIDSVTFTDDGRSHFDKVHPTRILPGAAARPDSMWHRLRPTALDEREERTYAYADSITGAMHLNGYVRLLPKIAESKLPVGRWLDLSLSRLYTYNGWEKTRLGVGLQTSDSLARWASIGGWAGYGFRDKEWKYGGFLELYADRYKDQWFRAAFSKELRDPGRLLLHPDLDKNYLRSFLMSRVDEVRHFSLSAGGRAGYWSATLTAQQEQLRPLYGYAFTTDAGAVQSYTANEGILQFRYAHGMRRSPAFGKYYDELSTRFPVLYGKVSYGQISSGAWSTNYVQAVAAVHFARRINRLGLEQLRVIAGNIWSDEPLPISRLFAGNGFRRGESSPYYFGAMLTMLPYDYYTDRFVNLYLRHDFERPLFRSQLTRTIQTAPVPALQYNLLAGTLNGRARHQGIAFGVPERAYQEAGVMLQDVVRLVYVRLIYLSLNVGYFYHLTPGAFDRKQGVLVYGLSASL